MDPISVNGVEISAAALAAEIQHHPAESVEAAQAKAATALAVRELLLQEAAQLNLEGSAEEDSDEQKSSAEEIIIQALLDQEISTPDADQETCRRYYENNRERFRTPDMFEAAHILFSASPEDKDAYQQATEQAVKTIADLQDRPESFDQIAKDLSDCPSKSDGGRLGQVGRGQTVPEFETFLFALEEGQLCPVPVKTRYGVHVLRLDHKTSGEQLPFEAVATKISDYLEDRAWHTAVAQYVRVLAGKADIVGVDLDGAQSPLVQ